SRNLGRQSPDAPIPWLPRQPAAHHLPHPPHEGSLHAGVGARISRRAACMIMRRIVGLALLCIISLVIAIALTRWTESLGGPRWLIVARNTFREAQITTVAIFAALAPRRRFVGITIIFTFYATCYLADFGFGTQQSMSRWSTIKSIAN